MVSKFLSSPSVGEVLRSNGCQGPGFDWCRLGLSLAVVAFHSQQLTGIEKSGFLFEFPFRSFVLAILPMFFGLSGFLVTGSALRLNDTKTFLLFRVLRIAPALIVEVTLSAFILGTIFTELPILDYLTNRHTWGYFGNVFGWIHFSLPGVFLDLPVSAVVNGNLWTLHPEFESYALMAALMATRLAYKRTFITLLWIAATAFMACLNVCTGQYEPTAGWFVGPVLVYYFFTGAVAFHWRDFIPVSFPLFVVALIIFSALLYVPQSVFLVPIPIMFVIVWLGMQKLPRINLLQSGDYSYGVYLFSYPIQQTIILLFPSMRHWWALFPTAAIISLVFAAASWHFVEKPFLKLKKKGRNFWNLTRFIMVKPML